MSQRSVGACTRCTRANAFPDNVYTTELNLKSGNRNIYILIFKYDSALFQIWVMIWIYLVCNCIFSSSGWLYSSWLNAWSILASTWHVFSCLLLDLVLNDLNLLKNLCSLQIESKISKTLQLVDKSLSKKPRLLKMVLVDTIYWGNQKIQ